MDLKITVTLNTAIKKYIIFILYMNHNKEKGEKVKENRPHNDHFLTLCDLNDNKNNKTLFTLSSTIKGDCIINA